MARLTWHGHATFSLETDGGQRLLFDPFLDENPAADIGAAGFSELDYILVSHGHGDHFSDAIPIARRTGATLISSFEIVGFCGEQGVENSHPLSIGGGHRFPFGSVKMTPALHGTDVAGSDGRVSCMPGGFLVDLGRTRLYHAGDTALIADMQLLEGEVDVALLPIGDNFTMGPRDAARAVEMIRPRVAIPMHYNTWELIAQDPEDFRRAVGDAAEVVVLEPGGSYDF